jgi:hypothetical protein
VSQKTPSDKIEAIQQFHLSIRRLADEPRPMHPVGRFSLCQIANVDQTPLPFAFSSGGTYADTWDKTVWVRGGASGLDKRQFTAQITLFADGVPRVKPLLIFKGKGKRISCTEKLSYDNRVNVTFQDNAWCDKNVMKTWIHQQWKPACEGNMMLVLDVHRAQKTDNIQQFLRSECNTEPVFVPAGTTSLVQPVDVVFNAPFKAAIEEKATAHLQTNLT